MITNEQIEQFIAQAHRVGDAGLTICSSGNISIDGFTPFSTSPVDSLQMETFSLGREGTQEPVPEISTSSPIRQEILPLLQIVSPASPTR